MPHNTEVAGRVRTWLTDREVHEVKMFGGLAFMVDERMLVCVSAGGSDLLVRVGPDSDAQHLHLHLHLHLHKSGARRAEMGKGRSMGPGWITVDAQALTTQKDLAYWMQAAFAFHAQDSNTRQRPQATTT